MQYSIKKVFAPKLFDTLRRYSRAQFGQDALAGVIVGIVAIPLAIAFGISSGVGPTEGLITAIIAGLLISTLIERSHKEGITIILSGVKTHVLHQLQTGGIEQMMNPDNICPNIHVALKRAEYLLKNA